MTLTGAAAALRKGSLKSLQLVNECLQRIDTYNPKLNAYITVMRESALAAAQACDKDAAAGKFRGPLHGIPIALKDTIDTAGARTTAGSAVFDSRFPNEDAEAVRRLTAAGAIVIGKTNLHEFASGGTSAVSYYGPVRNPWALDRDPGGSSGGSAAAMAADLCLAALGTDTGGSLRTPASLCGVVGLKPTYGRISIRGIVPLVWTLDHCGTMTRTVEDAAILLQVLAGYDPADIYSAQHPVPDYRKEMKQPVKQMRLGIVRTPFFDHIEPDIRAAVDEAIREVIAMTRRATDVVLEDQSGTDLAGEVYAYHEELFRTSANRYQIPVRRTLQNGAEPRAFEYVKSWRTVMTLRRGIDAWFDDKGVDLLVLPTRRRGPEVTAEALERAVSLQQVKPILENTAEFNVLGIPAITVPCGFTSDNLPVGLMIAGRPWAEGQVLALADAYEKATEWHKRLPPLAPDTKVPSLPPSNAAI